jgi:hypothetical protein
MGNISAFILGCLVTIWYRAKPADQKVVKATQQVSLAGTQCVTQAKKVLRTVGQRLIEIQAARVSQNPVIDDELRDILLEYAIDQIKQGKIKIVEDID